MARKKVADYNPDYSLLGSTVKDELELINRKLPSEAGISDIEDSLQDIHRRFENSILNYSMEMMAARNQGEKKMSSLQINKGKKQRSKL